jgi:predicted nucleic acid-binding protein
VKRLLVDVNVVLDAVLERGPQSGAAAKLWVAAETKRVEALIAAHGVTTLFDLLAHAKGSAFARRILGSITAAFGVAAVDQAVIGRALALAWPDFEDAVCAAAAEAAGCDAIVTRNPKGFSASSLPVLAPETAVALLDEEQVPETTEKIPESPARRRWGPGRPGTTIRKARKARHALRRSLHAIEGLGANRKSTGRDHDRLLYGAGRRG